MADLSAGATLCTKNEVITDFCSVISGKPGEVVEIALANSGTSRFNRAIYFEKITPSVIKELCAKEQNVSFLPSLSKELMQPLPVGSESSRKGSDRFIQSRRIVSFDLDFKDNPQFNRKTHVQEILDQLQVG